MGRCALRAATAADRAFLGRVYASTRTEELAVTGWSADQQAAFLAMQFNAQDHHYHACFPDAAFMVVTVEGEDVGRWYVDRSSSTLRLLDVALLPTWRGQGLGGELMNVLLADSRLTGKPIELHVEVNNPARRWYHRLGFVEVEDLGLYRRMRFAAEIPPSCEAADAVDRRPVAGLVPAALPS